MYIAEGGSSNVHVVCGDVTGFPGQIYTLTGVYSGASRPGYGGDGGPSTSAKVLMNGPKSVWVDTFTRQVYVSDTRNNRVRSISPSY